MDDRNCETESGGPCPETGLRKWRCGRCLIGGYGPVSKIDELIEEKRNNEVTER